MKYLVIGIVALGLAACNKADDRGTVGSGEKAYIERCIDGVIYLVRSEGYGGYMSVKFNPDSTVVTCEKT